MGLLLSHKRTCRISVDGITLSLVGGGGEGGGGKRGEIDGFSKASRMRLLKTMHSVKFERVMFLTLTYGKDYPEDPKKWKANLKEFRRRVEKKWEILRAIWRLELQDRGAPHFHLLIFDCPFMPVGEVQDIWYSILKTPTSLQFGNAVDLKIIRGISGKSLIMSYVSKYIGKPFSSGTKEESKKLGRIWGYWGLEDEKPIVCELFEKEAEELSIMIMGMWSKKYYIPDDLTRCTLFGEEMGTGEFQKTVKRLVEEIAVRHRYKKDNKVIFTT